MQGGRLKFYIGGLIIFCAIAFLIFSSTKANTSFFMTVDDLLAESGDYIGKSIKLSGAIVGDTISYDQMKFNLTFEIAHIPNNNAEIEQLGGLSFVLHEAAIDPSRSRVFVVYNGVKPDLLADEVQAIITGQLGEDGIFHADEILLKCPTRYEEALPIQVDE